MSGSVSQSVSQSVMGPFLSDSCGWPQNNDLSDPKHFPPFRFLVAHTPAKSQNLCDHCLVHCLVSLFKFVQIQPFVCFHFIVEVISNWLKESSQACECIADCKSLLV